MIRCPECDWELDEGDDVCPNCGAVLADYLDENTGDFEA
ncbi:MAG TPA: zinc ribbon domain-containing protein [Thermoplasmata archaeon]|nr:zinc ribbon domain-containing protein [Thermoplasmata archaeon]